jgi:hypothetical protein
MDGLMMIMIFSRDGGESGVCGYKRRIALQLRTGAHVRNLEAVVSISPPPPSINQKYRKQYCH